MAADEAVLQQLVEIGEKLGAIRAMCERNSEQNEIIAAQQTNLLEQNEGTMRELQNLANEYVSLRQRVTLVEEILKSDPPLVPPPYRPPMASLTQEERRAQNESIRVAVSEQTPYLEKIARGSKWTPLAVAAAIFLSTLFNNCHTSIPGMH